MDDAKLGVLTPLKVERPCTKILTNSRPVTVCTKILPLRWGTPGCMYRLGDKGLESISAKIITGWLAASWIWGSSAPWQPEGPPRSLGKGMGCPVLVNYLSRMRVQQQRQGGQAASGPDTVTQDASSFCVPSFPACWGSFELISWETNNKLLYNCWHCGFSSCHRVAMRNLSCHTDKC